MQPGRRDLGRRERTQAWIAIVFVLAPMVVFGQASPILTGAESLQTNIIAWLTPIAIIAVMVLGVMAMANQISWGWCIAAILGIALAFGSPQIVAWIRDMFAV